MSFKHQNQTRIRSLLFLNTRPEALYIPPDQKLNMAEPKTEQHVEGVDVREIERDDGTVLLDIGAKGVEGGDGGIGGLKLSKDGHVSTPTVAVAH